MPTNPLLNGIASRCGKPAISGYIDIARWVFWHAHPTTIRMVLALSSALFAGGMLITPDAMELKQYHMMMTIMPGWLWEVLLIVHFLGVFWRIFDAVPRVRWALAINILGCFLWFTITISVSLSVGLFLPGSSPSVVICAFAAWALIRTGIGKDVGTP